MNTNKNELKERNHEIHRMTRKNERIKNFRDFSG